MDRILESCEKVFGRCSRPFGIVKVVLDDDGAPKDAIVEYLNPALAATADSDPQSLYGTNIYELWPDGDRTWLEHFYRAAYFGEASEFETVNVAFKTFMNVIVFPVVEGYCGFEIQDVTNWLTHSHSALESMSAGMFFYGPANQFMMLTEPACECCDLENGYLSAREFADTLFPEPAASRIYESIVDFSSEYDRILFEEQMKNGKWIRLSMSHGGSESRFSVGILEDVTQLREAEMASARRSEIIESLSSEYFAIYIVNLERNRIKPYLLRNEVAEFYARLIREDSEYSTFLDDYCREFVVGDMQEDFHALMDRDYLLSHMPKEGGDFSVVFKRRFGSEEQFIELRLLQVVGEQDEYILAARDINAEMTEQLNQKEALQSALALAEHASQAKTTFLTNISHDFRTPLNSIMGFANLALENLDDKERVRDIIGKILLSSEHLLDLVTDILNVSRIESGKVVIEEAPLDLKAMFTALQESFVPQAVASQIEFKLDVSGVKHFKVLGDQLRMSRIIVNTVGNALKYTDSGGRIDVVISEGDKAPNGSVLYEFLVKDTGRGMSKEFVERIFMPFERDSKGSAHGEVGTGLGMTITKNLVDLLGGSISVNSELGVGSEFLISIPLKVAEGQSDADKASGESSEKTYDFTGFRVLIADDDALSREMLEGVLSSKGLQVETAGDGTDAVSLFEESEEGHFDAIIMDMRMPQMTGDDATRIIRAMPRKDATAIPIIAATADAFEEGHRRAREAGMTAHITKPLNSKQLFALLDEYLG